MNLDVSLELRAGLQLRLLTPTPQDVDLLVEAASGETARSLWGAHPCGPYSADDARTALHAWDPDSSGQASYGMLCDGRMLGAFGLMLDGGPHSESPHSESPHGGNPHSAELAYWVRPENRRQGLALRGIRALTPAAHRDLRLSRIWLEIDPGNAASLSLAARAGYTYEGRLPRHCRAWNNEDPRLDDWHDCLIWADTEAAAR